MKLKALFIIFNIVLFSLLFTIFFLPLFYANGTFMREFWYSNWFFGPLFLIMLLVVDTIFFKNQKLIEAIETEDWTALAMYLEDKILDKKEFKFKNVSLLADSLLLLGDFSSMTKLELTLKNNKIEYLNKLAPKFAAAKMLSENYTDLAEFSSRFHSQENAEWMLFYHALGLHMTKDLYKSAEAFKNLKDKAENYLVKVLSAYFLLSILKNYSKMTDAEILETKQAVIALIEKHYTPQTWKKYTESQKQELHVMVLKKLISDSSAWLWNKNE